MSNNLFITGISTDVGKTIVAATLCQKYGYDYWKPIQCGIEDGGDSTVISKLVTHPECTIHRPRYELKAPISPHAAAKLEGVVISIADIQTSLPAVSKELIIEGAGGLLVPLNDSESVVDIAVKLDCKVILVSRHYLGSINHTLLSIEAIQLRNLELAGIVFIGDENIETESIIKSRIGKDIMHGRFPITETININSFLQHI